IEQVLQEGCLKVVLLLLDDAALWVGGQLPAMERVTIVGPGQAKAAVALEKERQIESAREAGFAVPSTVLLTNGDTTDLSANTFPLILKPARAISSKEGRLEKSRFHFCTNVEELTAAVRTYTPGEPLLAQQYVSGVGEGIFGLAT